MLVQKSLSVESCLHHDNPVFNFTCTFASFVIMLKSSSNVMAHGDAREGKWRGNRRMEWVASTLHTTSEHGVSSITTADAYTSAASSRLNWCLRRFKWTRPFRGKTKSGFCACAITFQTQSTKKKVEILQTLQLFFICHNLHLEWLGLTENILSLQFQNHWFNDDFRKNRYLFWELYKMCTCVVFGKMQSCWMLRHVAHAYVTTVT